MLKASIILSLFVMQILPLVAQERTDSISTFRFRLRKDFFWAGFKDNDSQIETLLNFVELNKDAILNKSMPLHVSGFCNSLPTRKANLAIAKLRSNRVKSELIVRKGLKEECFITRNSAEKGDWVTVWIFVPGTDTVTFVQDKPAFPLPKSEYPVPVQPFQLPCDNVLSECKEEKKYCRFAFKTNLLYWAALMFNVETELYLKKRWSVNIDYQYVWWSNRSKHKYYRIAALSPEVRYWFASKENFRGHFGGFYLGTGLYEFMAKPTYGIQGEFFIAGGLSYGYMFPVNRKLRMELSLGAGYMMTEYRQYHWDRGCYVYEKTQRYSYFGPTKAKVSLVLPVNLFKRRSRIGM